MGGGLISFPAVAENVRALIASPSSSLREHLLERMEGRCERIEHVHGGADALAKLEEGDWQVLFLDRRLPDLDCDELLAIIHRRFPGIQVIVLDAESTLPAGRSVRLASGDTVSAGARDISPNHVLGMKTVSGEPPEELEQSLPNRCRSLPGMIGRSESMQRLYHLAQLVAPRNTTVLILGPTGSGKELVARALHALSPRAARPFVAVNCAAIPEALLESELFGYVRGAFTGAVQAQLGRIAAAHGGTLFLDEVGELPLGMQAKLLRFLEEKEVQRLGSAESARVDVRILAASNIDMAARAERGEFREDLFYRLAAFPLQLPPLSERACDIVPLAQHFLASMAAAMNLPCPRLGAEASRILETHPWKGNVRELQHVMERASILVEQGDTVLGEHLYFPFQSTAPAERKSLSCAVRAS